MNAPRITELPQTIWVFSNRRQWQHQEERDSLRFHGVHVMPVAVLCTLHFRQLSLTEASDVFHNLSIRTAKINTVTLRCCAVTEITAQWSMLYLWLPVLAQRGRETIYPIFLLIFIIFRKRILRRPSSDIVETYPYDVLLASIENCYSDADLPKAPANK